VRFASREWFDAVAAALNAQPDLAKALSGQVRVEGDLEALVRRAGYRYVVDAALRVVPTELP